MLVERCCRMKTKTSHKGPSDVDWACPTCSSCCSTPWHSPVRLEDWFHRKTIDAVPRKKFESMRPLLSNMRRFLLQYDTVEFGYIERERSFKLELSSEIELESTNKITLESHRQPSGPQGRLTSFVVSGNSLYCKQLFDFRIPWQGYGLSSR